MQSGHNYGWKNTCGNNVSSDPSRALKLETGRAPTPADSGPLRALLPVSSRKQYEPSQADRLSG